LGKKLLFFPFFGIKRLKIQKDYYESLLRRSVGLGLDLDSLITELLYPMESEEEPQGVPDGVLVVYVEPLIYKVVQSFYEDPCEGQADANPIGFVRHLLSPYLTIYHLITYI